MFASTAFAEPPSVTDLEKLKARRKRETERVAKEFETVYIQQMLKEIYKDAPLNPETGGGYAEEMYRQLLVEALAKEIAKKNGMGIANKLVDDINKKQNFHDQRSTSRRKVQ
jgi:Rod binding domain-containing protein